MSNPHAINAWMMLQDEPSGSCYSDPDSCYQALIKNDVYQSIDVLFVAFVKTVEGSNGWTIEIPPGTHCGGTVTSQQYLEYVVRDARQQNPGIRIAVTLGYGNGSNISQIFPDPDHPDEPRHPPTLQIFDTCTHLIRTLPSLVYDPNKPEDVNTDGEDHAYDTLRYALMEMQKHSDPLPRSSYAFGGRR